MTIEKEGMSAA